MLLSRTKLAKAAGYLFIFAVMSICTVTIFAFAMEFSGAAHFLTTKLFPSYYASIPLHKTNYYGSLRERDPYQMYLCWSTSITCYLFSAPWLKRGIGMQQITILFPSIELVFATILALNQIKRLECSWVGPPRSGSTPLPMT